MAITTAPTAADGTSARHSDMVYVHPDRRRSIEDLEGFAEGMNGPFVADMLSAFLMHERCGHALYRSVAGRTHNPMLKRKYQHFGDETAEHVEVLEQAIERLGGDPGYVSPAARAVRAMGDATLQATFLTSGGLDVMTAEMAMLDAVLVAETIDHANWEGVRAMAEAAPSGPVSDTLREAYDRVGPDEDEHLQWARTMRLRMTTMQASSEAMATMGAKAEEMIEAVTGWFSDDDA